MLCAIYKSKKKDGMYLYVEKRDQFNAVPDSLRQIFGTPIFVMLFNLKGNKPLVHANNQEVIQNIQQQGFYLQMPPLQENLLEQYKNYHL
ncbi:MULTISPECIES: YcgL domain-containing protein [unclassified Lonepinella]|uniref:YcgL domain-containing protein n=1 Tax=unclassified Lonepinella TaxID=2642006 RepID=UPI0036DD7E79